ncbi:MAG TPA: 50S ribosomal protein L11 methyltransferase [Gammaproteobacteria bacterium]|nr:50S ribosomal protein L11 methyltransferase [Gammaproteobacteria bacterium]
MAWLELTLECDGSVALRLSDFLTDSGAVSVSLSNASEEILIQRDPGSAPLWPATRVRGLFDQEADLERLIPELRKAGFGAPQIARVEDREWSRAWQQHFRPKRFGGRLWILPSFAEAPAEGGVCVRLDPGLAFGSGSHPTTELCLEWLAAVALEGKELIDYGCGSGILAIAALRLGARAARCVDNDGEALATARKNARNNGVDDRMSCFLPEDLPPHPADLLVANILSEPLIELAEPLTNLLPEGGRIALSGILNGQADSVTEAYEGYIAFGAAESRDGWVRLSGTRLPSAA